MARTRVSDTELVLLKKRLGVLDIGNEHQAIADALGTEFMKGMEDSWTFSSALMDINTLQELRPDKSDLEIARSLREDYEEVKCMLDDDLRRLFGRSLREVE
jgi:hypothetical protein